MTIETVLRRFEGVREIGLGRYKALCSAHDDNTPSLDIKQADGGRILIICRAHCPTSHVLASAGLTFSELFTERQRIPDGVQRRAVRRRESQAEIDHAVIVCRLATIERDRGVTHSECDLQTIQRAADFLKRVPSAQRKLSDPPLDVTLDTSDESLHRSIDALRDCTPKTSLCDSCGKPYDQSTTLPDSWLCLSCEANHG